MNSEWSVTASRSEGVQIEEIVPDFWPVEIYNRLHDEKAHIDQIRELEFKGQKIRGLYVPPDGRPLPPGCFKLSNFDKTSVDTKQVLETSDGQLDEKQAALTTEALRKRFHNSAGPSAECHSPTAKRKALKAVIEESPEPSKRRKGEATSDEESDGDGFCFCTFSFPENSGTKPGQNSDGKTNKAKRGTQGSPLKKGRRNLAKKSPKRKAKPSPKAKASGAGTPSPKPKPGNSTGAGQIPEWRQRHNRQRRLQQVDQHLLLAQQFIDTFQACPSKIVTAQVTRILKLVQESLETDNSFMQYMQDEAGAVVGENLDKAHADVGLSMCRI